MPYTRNQRRLLDKAWFVTPLGKTIFENGGLFSVERDIFFGSDFESHPECVKALEAAVALGWIKEARYDVGFFDAVYLTRKGCREGLQEVVDAGYSSFSTESFRHKRFLVDLWCMGPMNVYDLIMRTMEEDKAFSAKLTRSPDRKQQAKDQYAQECIEIIRWFMQKRYIALCLPHTHISV